MKVTASQIRQDFNNFGGFGQQGYGYNIDSLRKEIGQILGTYRDYSAVLVGPGHLGTALVENFQTTVCSGRLGSRKLKGRQQKGFAEEVQAMVDAVKAGGPAPIPFEEIENVTRATFAVQRALKSGAAETI